MKRKYKIEGLTAKNFNIKTNDDGSEVSYTLKLKVDKKKPHDFWQQIGFYTRPDFKPCESWQEFFDAFIRNPRCSHEHDCCGCWNSYLYEVKKVGRYVYFKTGEAMNI